MAKKIIYVGADHAGFYLKEKMVDYLKKLGYIVDDFGNWEYDKNDDYPDFGYKVAKAVSEKKSRGVLFCGSAEGVCIVANKVKGIRAVSVWDKKIAKLSRTHNDANVLCLSGGEIKGKVPGLGLSEKKAKEIIKVWLETKFSGAKRHVRRLNKIKKIEAGKFK